MPVSWATRSVCGSMFSIVRANYDRSSFLAVMLSLQSSCVRDISESTMRQHPLSTPRLGVNLDHVATLRQARGGREPDPVQAAVLADLGGADVITVHLREDRRHIQDRDLKLLRELIGVALNLELATSEDVLALAIEVKPDQLTLVPERRAELTTEGGLDVVGQKARISEVHKLASAAGMCVSLFIDPDPRQVEAAVSLGVPAVELHTGRYANARTPLEIDRELEALERASREIASAGLELHAGHGLNLKNVGPVAAIENMAELNIGHAIVARAVFVGLERSVREMKDAMAEARGNRRIGIVA